jgi:predicted phage terminase large subunit-like protein
MSKITADEFRVLTRRDLAAFTHRVFLHLHPSLSFMSNWHIDVILAKLEECRTGQCKRLIINVPPRSLKSICASVAFPAWVLGHDPTSRLICVSYAQELADKHARDCRNVVSSDWYKKLFDTRLSEQRQAIAEFTTTMNGFRVATSVGGVITGLGADFIVIDDPLKPDEALSETRRKGANEWIGHTVYSRLNDKRTGCMIIVMQRLHEDDLVGYVQRQSQENWDVLNFPAAAEEPQTFSWATPFGRFTHQRAKGDILHPEREPREQLDVLRANLGEYHYASQYQQNPAPRGGGMVKEEWFKRYRENELPEKFDSILQSWDTANKPTEFSDYSVCTTWGLKEKRIYLLNVFRKQLDYPNLKRATQQQYEFYRPNTMLIEDKASGTQLIQELREAGISTVTPYKSTGDKIMRFRAQTGVIENGLVYLPEQAHWLPEYLHELKTFPNGRYDDQVDSTSQALESVKRPFPGWGIMKFYQDLAAGPQKEPSQEVEMIAPGNVSTVYTVDGRQINVGSNRRIIVRAEDVAPLMGAGFKRVV